MVQVLWKTVWWVLKKLNMKLPFDLAIPLLVIFPRETKTHVHTKIVHMFTGVLFIIAKK